MSRFFACVAWLEEDACSAVFELDVSAALSDVEPLCRDPTLAGFQFFDMRHELPLVSQDRKINADYFVGPKRWLLPCPQRNQHAGVIAQYV